MKKLIYSVLLFLMMVTPLHFVNAENNVQSTRNTMLDGNFQLQLQLQLKPDDYQHFYANLENFSAPYTLKNGSQFYEARRDNLNSASAIVIDPKGYFYLAYQIPYSNRITYITNDQSCSQEVHDAIKVFVNTIPTKPSIIFSSPIQMNKQPHFC